MCVCVCVCVRVWCVCVYVCVASYMCVFVSTVCQMAAGSGSKARWLGKLSDKCIYHWNKEINTIKLNF